MYVNLHTLPPGQSMFTLFIRQSDEPAEWGEGAEEVDIVASDQASGDYRLIAQVIEAAREELVRDYGPKTEVLGLVNQSTGTVLFDYRWEGHIALPVVLPNRILESFTLPYDGLLDLAFDEASGRGAADYRNWLLERES